MRIIILFLLLTAITTKKLNVQERRDFTVEEKIVHNKNVKGIMGKWNTTEIAFKM